jgi:hypothetical protein
MRRHLGGVRRGTRGGRHAGDDDQHCPTRDDNDGPAVNHNGDHVRTADHGDDGRSAHNVSVADNVRASNYDDAPSDDHDRLLDVVELHHPAFTGKRRRRHPGLDVQAGGRADLRRW